MKEDIYAKDRSWGERDTDFDNEQHEKEFRIYWISWQCSRLGGCIRHLYLETEKETTGVETTKIPKNSSTEAPLAEREETQREQQQHRHSLATTTTILSHSLASEYRA
jgi:hypothetical protein